MNSYELTNSILNLRKKIQKLMNMMNEFYELKRLVPSISSIVLAGRLLEMEREGLKFTVHLNYFELIQAANEMES